MAARRRLAAPVGLPPGRARPLPTPQARTGPCHSPLRPSSCGHRLAVLSRPDYRLPALPREQSSGLDKGRRPVRCPADRAASGLPALARSGPPRGFPCQARCGLAVARASAPLKPFVEKVVTGCQGQPGAARGSQGQPPGAAGQPGQALGTAVAQDRKEIATATATASAGVLVAG
jgi:hypothetical protein